MRQDIKERIEQIQNGIVPEGYKKTKVGIIPEHWEVKKLRDLGEFFRGKGVPKSQIVSNGFPAITYGQLYTKYNNVIKDINTFIPKKVIDKSLEIKKGDILFASSGETAEDIGKSAIYLSDKSAYAGGDIIVFRPCNKIKNKVYGYLLNSEPIRQQKYKSGEGHSIVHIYIEHLQTLVVPVLKESEQQRIASILETWDRAIELKEKYIQEKQTQKKGLIKQLLQPRENWIKIKLKDLGSTYTGLSGKTKEDFGQGKKFITYKNIFDNSEVDLEIYNRVNIEVGENQNEVKYGDVFFTTSSETPHEVGMSSVLLTHSEDTYYLNSFCFGYRLNNFETVLPQFLKFYLRSEEFRRKIFSLAQGSTRFNLSKNELMKLKIEAPPITEQQHIAKILSTADREIELLNEEVELLKQQKKGLMQLLLTGIIRVKGDDDGSNDIR